MKCPICNGTGKMEDKSLFGTRYPASKIFTSSGNHPKLIQAKELIERARELERQVKEEQDIHRKTIKPIYLTEVTVHTNKNSYSSKIPDGEEYVRIVQSLTNGEDFIEHMKYFGSVSGPSEETRTSVAYYRKNNFLLHDHGGWMLLEDEQPCNDEEWEDIKKGNIPKKFIRKEN